MAIVMAWVGFASSSFAVGVGQQASMMSSQQASMDMPGMNMSDCPSSKSSMMKMDIGKCALSCYGLATSALLEPLPAFFEAPLAFDGPVEHGSQLMFSRGQSVPTPPPNFA